MLFRSRFAHTKWLFDEKMLACGGGRLHQGLMSISLSAHDNGVDVAIPPDTFEVGHGRAKLAGIRRRTLYVVVPNPFNREFRIARQQALDETRRVNVGTADQCKLCSHNFRYRSSGLILDSNLKTYRLCQIFQIHIMRVDTCACVTMPKL